MHSYLVPQTESKITQQFPLGAGLAVRQLLCTIMSNLCAPEGIDSQVLIEHHEKIIQPALAKALVAKREAGFVLLVAVLALEHVKKREVGSGEW